MKRLLLPVVMFMIAIGSIQTASAKQTDCPPGRMVDSCSDRLKLLKENGEKLLQCFKDLDTEYEGGFGGGAGKGKYYLIQLAKCQTLASDVAEDLEGAYVPGGDTSLKRKLRDAADKWGQALEAAKSAETPAEQMETPTAK